MNTRNLIWGSLALVLLVGGATAQPAASGADEKAVAAGEMQWLKSQQTNNTDLLAPLLADKVVETTDEGKVHDGKDAVIASAKEDHWTSVDYADLKVMVYGHAAVAIGTFTGKGTHAGKPMDVKARFTDTWVKQANGKWLCVASQDSLLK
jgi:ketosteroid isomerase-like protein